MKLSDCTKAELLWVIQRAKEHSLGSINGYLDHALSDLHWKRAQDRLKRAEAERYAARLETMCKGQDKQLMEVQEGALELQRAMDGVLMAAALEHGEAVKNDQTGETVGWRLRIPDIDAGRMAEQYLLHARKDLENGGYVVSVVPRGQV